MTWNQFIDDEAAQEALEDFKKMHRDDSFLKHLWHCKKSWQEFTSQRFRNNWEGIKDGVQTFNLYLEADMFNETEQIKYHKLEECLAWLNKICPERLKVYAKRGPKVKNLNRHYWAMGILPMLEFHKCPRTERYKWFSKWLSCVDNDWKDARLLRLWWEKTEKSISKTQDVTWCIIKPNHGSYAGKRDKSINMPLFAYARWLRKKKKQSLAKAYEKYVMAKYRLKSRHKKSFFV